MFMTSERPERFKTVFPCFANPAAKSEEARTNHLETIFALSVKIFAEIECAHFRNKGHPLIFGK